MTELKICGITKNKDAIFCAENGVDYIGFIFYKQSKRYIEPIKAKEITDEIGKSFKIKTIGVFVNEKTEEVNKIAQLLNLDFVQLHGLEPKEYCEKINYPIIKNIRKLSEIETYNKVQILMTDFVDNENWGGVNKICDWSLARQIKERTDKKFILSGGLNINNLKEAILKVNPDIIDISSGVEIEKGIKDHKKIEEIIREIK